jgi:hypothetical protein
MPEGKGYTAKQIQAMRNEGVFSPSEILALERDNPPTADNSTRSGPLKGAMQGALVGGLGGASEIRSRGYKYFPDN